MDDQTESTDQPQPTPQQPPSAPAQVANQQPPPPVTPPKAREQGQQPFCRYDPPAPPEDKLTKGDWGMIILTGIIAFGTLVSAAAIGLQGWLMYKGGVDTTRMADAAEKQQKAAQQFADTADKINGNMNDAVAKLNLQAGALTYSGDQAARLAKDTEQANGNAVQSDRPWMGGLIQVENFDVGKKPSFNVFFTNSGRRPARIDITAFRSHFFTAFPSDPDSTYIFDTTPSTTVVVPGQSSQAIGEDPTELTQNQMDALSAGILTYFVFAKVEYRDIRTNEEHWTHICLRFMPKMKTPNNNGFRNCTEYNEAN